MRQLDAEEKDEEVQADKEDEDEEEREEKDRWRRRRRTKEGGDDRWTNSGVHCLEYLQRGGYLERWRHAGEGQHNEAKSDSIPDCSIRRHSEDADLRKKMDKRIRRW